MNPITNEVLLEKIEGLTRLVDERFEMLIVDNKKDHDSLIAQTTKTNGNVTVLQKWMATSKGAIAVISATVVPVMLYLLYLHIGK